VLCDTESSENDNTPVLIERLERLLSEIDVKRNGLEPVIPLCLAHAWLEARLHMDVCAVCRVNVT
jgi:hypothetical protein